MIEGQESTSGAAARAGNLCEKVGKAFSEIASIFTPPEEAEKHFRQARVEMLRGVRELIDIRIANLSRSQSKGTHVVVE